MGSPSVSLTGRASSGHGLRPHPLRRPRPRLHLCPRLPLPLPLIAPQTRPNLRVTPDLEGYASRLLPSCFECLDARQGLCACGPTCVLVGITGLRRGCGHSCVWGLGGGGGGRPGQRGKGRRGVTELHTVFREFEILCFFYKKYLVILSVQT